MAMTRFGPPLLPLTAAAVLSFIMTAWVASVTDSSPGTEELRDVVYGQSSGGRGTSNDATQRIRDSSDPMTAEYGFTSFNKDRLTLKFEFGKKEYQEYYAGYGYSTKEIDALKAWRQTANKEAFAKAVAARKSQSQLDAAVADVSAQFSRKLKAYLTSRRFVLMKDNSVDADVPRYVRDSAPFVDSLALQLDAAAKKKHYESSDLIDALASFVQTALIYNVPPNVEGDIHTGGIWPPVATLLKGWGDCDTKTAAMGAILSHWKSVRMLGVAVPDHYLLAVLKAPLKGDLTVEYHGTPYVLVETAGPAWLPPGTISASTAPLLENPDGYKLEPFFTE
jgi:hypothetical protein